MKLVNDQVPGKLYIIGEYNILKSGHSALLSPINLYLEGRLEESDKTLLVEKGVCFDINGFTPIPHHLHNTVKAIQFFTKYIEFIGKKPLNFTYYIKNNLISVDNSKYGFGSSGASIVLSLKLLNTFYETKLSLLELFKMAVLIQVELDHLSSGGDLACSLFNKPIVYSRYDLAWLKSQTDFMGLIHLPWPLLDIKVIDNLPEFAIGWTKETTKPEIKGSCPDEFYTKAEELVRTYINSFNPVILSEYQTLLNTLELYKPGLLTPKLVTLIESAKRVGLSAKLSGAGYGDCGIVQLTRSEDKTTLKEIWVKENIEFLDVWRK